MNTPQTITLCYVYAGPCYGRLHELIERGKRDFHVRAVAAPQHSFWVHPSDCEELHFKAASQTAPQQLAA